MENHRFTIDAQKSGWQHTGIVLGAKDLAVVTVDEYIEDPSDKNKRIEQKWGIIEPKKRGTRSYWGYETKAGARFVKPGSPEGSVVVSKISGEGKTAPDASDLKAFERKGDRILFRGPGEIVFMPNEELQTALELLVNPSSFADNTGSISVNVVVKHAKSSLRKLP